MKKHWKLIIGILFLLGGIGCITTDLGAFVFGVVVGGALIAWEVLPRLKKAPLIHNKSSNDAIPTKIVDTPVQTVNKSATPETPPVATIKHDTPPFDIINADNQKYSNYLVPASLDNASKFSDRKVKLTYVNKDVADEALKEKRWELTLSLVNGRVHAFSDGQDIGALPNGDNSQKCLEAGDPYIAILEQVNDKNGCKARIVLYRNKVKYYADHEQTVVGLTGYKSKAFQENGEWIPLDAELYARGEDVYYINVSTGRNNIDKVIVFYERKPIGYLPSKVAKRYWDEDPVLIVFDHSEDDDSGKSQPFVRIYW